jgi:hypothetical protein
MSAQACHSSPFGSGALPQDAVYARGLFPLIRGHSFHSQELGVERVGEQVLQGTNLVPPALLHSLCDTQLQPSDFASGVFPIDTRPFLRVASGCTSRSCLLLSHLRRFYRFSRNGTPVGRGHAFHQERGFSRFFALSHISCPIRCVTQRPLLLPTSHCRPSMGLPYGRLAMHRAWRTDGLSTFRVIAVTDNLGGTLTPVTPRSRCRYVIDLQPGYQWRIKSSPDRRAKGSQAQCCGLV